MLHSKPHSPCLFACAVALACAGMSSAQADPLSALGFSVAPAGQVASQAGHPAAQDLSRVGFHRVRRPGAVPPPGGAPTKAPPVAVPGAPSTPVAAQNPLGLLIPAYFDPTSDAADWQAMTQAATKVPLVAIMNPNSGPGTAQDPTYSAAVVSLHAAGGAVIGYVHTSYGQRPLADVESDIANYYKWYPVNGIFIDEMASTATPTLVAYYQNIARYIRQLQANAFIVANPGQAFDVAFAAAGTANTYVDAENPATSVNATAQSAWESQYPAGTFAEMALGAVNDAQEVGTLSARNIGWVYSTTLPYNPNPYANLPADFNAEVAAVQAANITR